jgi:hypothetical protein
MNRSRSSQIRDFTVARLQTNVDESASPHSASRKKPQHSPAALRSESSPCDIAVDQVRLALVGRRIAEYQRDNGRADEACRWAAMSTHTEVLAGCGSRFRTDPPTTFKHPSTMRPMDRGHLHRAIARMRMTQGLVAIRKTFGCGLRAILAETASTVLR